ncbi:MAG: universal stress protein [Bacteroidetes bacterium]|nr:universal stress protein [Bacteroidota bacterium]MDA1121808.1 universal stress protein [Bacteroidota bacterium]
MYKKILVPTDFSKEANNALETAAILANKESSEIILLNVIEDPYSPVFKSIGGISEDIMSNVFVIELKKKIRERLDQIVDEKIGEGLNIRSLIKIGHPYGSIAECIREVNADLIILGSKGSSGLDEMLVGSTAENIVKYVKCPVITVKEKCDLTNIKSILYPTDLKEEQEEALRDIKELQKAHNAHLHLVKVYDSDFVTKNEVETRMKKFAEYFELEDYSIEAIRHPDEAEAILGYAEKLDVSLIAMATHYRRGLEVLFNTRISKHVVNHAKRPIWTKRVS